MKIQEHKRKKKVRVNHSKTRSNKNVLRLFLCDWIFWCIFLMI